MWVMIILAVHTNNPNDVPGRIELTFLDHSVCQQVLSTIQYKLKFESFKVIAKCEKKPS